MKTSTLFFPIIAAVFVQICIAIGLRIWASWVGRRHASPWWRRLAWLPLIALALSLTGLSIATVFLLRAFDAVQVDAANRAAEMARNISHAMNASAFLSLPSWALYAVSLVSSLIGTILRPTPETEK